MKKLDINTIVRLKPSYAKWHLDHPEIYGRSPIEMDDSYESDTLLHLTCCLGEPIYGIVTKKGNSGCWKINFYIDQYSANYYVEKHHVDIITDVNIKDLPKKLQLIYLLN